MLRPIAGHRPEHYVFRTEGAGRAGPYTRNGMVFGHAAANSP